MRVVNSLSDSCTGIGVIADFAAVVLIRHGLHVWHDNTHRKIELLYSLQEVSGICKTRNQLNAWCEIVWDHQSTKSVKASSGRPSWPLNPIQKLWRAICAATRACNPLRS